MNFKSRFVKYLSPTDFIIIVFYLFLSVSNLVFNSKIEYWYLIIVANFILISFILFLAKKDGESDSSFWKNLHYWYVLPLVFFTFKEINVIIRTIHSVDYDWLLIAADRFLIGKVPSEVLINIANPILTEILQISYYSFFFLPVILALEMQINKRPQELSFAIFTIIYGFLLSYIGYLFLPAVGPRFTLHNFSQTNKELPGLFLTNIIREIINSGEGIPSGTLNPMQVVQRDVFPSGHTQMTLLVLYLAVRYKSKFKIPLIIVGSLLIFATLYLRYHYFVDLLGGLAFMFFTILTNKQLYNWWQKKTGNTLFYYNK